MNRWLEGRGRRGADYDARWEARAAAGLSVHGEADLVAALAPESVLDAGCGTGRVAIELAARGMDVCGVDLDPTMLDQARAKAPHLRWVLGDLADPTLDLRRTFDVVVAAGNVMLFVTPGTEGAVLATMRRHLGTGGWLVAGFQTATLTAERYDRLAAAAGLEAVSRWATWERDPWVDGGDYAVCLHRG